MKSTLYTILDKFKKEGLSQKDRQNIENGNVPSLFSEIAKAIVNGYFLVSDNSHSAKVIPTCVEIYYHEESENGIKDPIVYHKNTKTGTKKPIFAEIGILHNHVSGIDITFEREDNNGEAVRASALIREFKVEGINGFIPDRIKKYKNPDDRSTNLYEALFSLFNVFDGFSIEWKDGDSDYDIESHVRKNVAQYGKDNNGNDIKLPASGNGNLDTENRKHLQCIRKWQFRRI